MKGIKFLSIFAIATLIGACSNSSTETHVESHDTATCTEHEHGQEHGHEHGEDCANLKSIVVGIAQKGDYTSGKISIKTLDGETKDFDYKKSNQDKIAAWQAGDTVSIVFGHHHHGEAAHDSITAIKLGAIAPKAAKCDDAHQHEHENCDGHDHKH